MSEGLFERMLVEAQASFTLAAAAEGIEVAPGREADLVAMAMQAGVVGALAVDREATAASPTPGMDVVVARLDEVLAILRRDR